jgi:hypothetical protein
MGGAMGTLQLLRRLCWAGMTAVGLMLPVSAHAAASQAQADAVVVTALSLIKDEDLEFGTMLAGPTAGIVIVPPSGARTATGGVTLVGNTFYPARFAGRGRLGQTVQISINANILTINRVGGGATMLVDTWTVGSTPTATITTNPRAFTISSPTGVFNFPLGARLRVGASQLPGTYRGTFTITLNYQ